MNTKLRKVPFSPPDITEAEANEVRDVILSGWITTGQCTKKLDRIIVCMYVHGLKRFFDFCVALCGLLVLVIVLVCLAPFYFFLDKGPMFYSGKRLGLNGKPFPMHKFRSMKVNAPDIRLEDGSTYNGDDDHRVTSLGRFVRKTSLDEIPQIWNVLVGDMSLIGPRPDPLDWMDKYREEDKVFLTVRPGITGYNQAYYRNSADAEMKIKNDVYYAKNISFSLDVKIILRTIKTVLFRENINVNRD